MCVSFVYNVISCSRSSLNSELDFDFTVIRKANKMMASFEFENFLWCIILPWENGIANEWYMTWQVYHMVVIFFLGANFGGLAESFMFNMGHFIRKVELNSKFWI